MGPRVFSSVAIFTCALLIGGWIFFALQPPAPAIAGPKREDASSYLATLDSGFAKSGAATSEVRRSEAVPGRGARLQVSDEEGNSLADVIVWQLRDSRRYLDPAVDLRRGATALDGSLALDFLPAEGAELCLEKSGFCSRRLPFRANEDCAVMLARGLELSVVLRDRRGQPLAGLPVAMSRVALPTAAFDPEEHARRRGSADAAEGVHVARSDERGFAQLAGLMPGRHHMALGAGDWHWVDAPPEQLVDLPSREINATLAPIYLAALLFEGEQPINLNWEGSNFVAGGGARDLAASGQRVARRVQHRFPAAHVWTFVTDVETSSPVVRVVALYSGGRRRTIECPAVAAAEFDQPTLVEGAADASEQEIGRLILRAADTAGQPFELGGIHVWNRSLDVQHAIVLETATNQELELPAGSYQISVSGLAKHFLEKQTCEVRGGERTELLIQSPWRFAPLEIQVPMFRGEGLSRVDLEISSGHGPGEVLFLDGKQKLVRWLPEGEVRLRAHGLGLASSEQLLSIDVGAASPAPVVLNLGG